VLDWGSNLRLTLDKKKSKVKRRLDPQFFLRPPRGKELQPGFASLADWGS